MGKRIKQAPTATQNTAGKPPIPVDSRADAELLARWVEQLFQRYPDMIAREAEWAREHPLDRDSTGRLVWLRHALSTMQFIAHRLRADRVRGPVAGE